MSRFKTREEYERWKAERFGQEGGASADGAQPARPTGRGGPLGWLGRHKALVAAVILVVGGALLARVVLERRALRQFNAEAAELSTIPLDRPEQLEAGLDKARRTIALGAAILERRSLPPEDGSLVLNKLLEVRQRFTAAMTRAAKDDRLHGRRVSELDSELCRSVQAAAAGARDKRVQAMVGFMQAAGRFERCPAPASAPPRRMTPAEAAATARRAQEDVERRQKMLQQGGP